jgi:predicted ArsR family transcriptional regulator
MNFFVDENSTRKNIIFLLKKSGGMSIEELSKVIDITPMGVRQHLLALEKKGMVTYIAKKRGIGRPGFVYMLAEAADDHFPKAYDNLALGMLRDIKKHDGQEKIDKIFGWRRDRLLKMKKQALAGKIGLDDTLHSLKELLEAEGYLVELSKNGKYYHLKQYHCPIHKVAREFKEACKHELLLYRDLIDRDITREQAISENAPSCLYLIPKA